MILAKGLACINAKVEIGFEINPFRNQGQNLIK
jgi:hypothetical protein